VTRVPREAGVRDLAYYPIAMVLFPIALLWLVGVIIWVVRNEAKPENERKLDWRRWRPRPPRRPGGSGRFGGAGARAARSTRRSVRREATATHDRPLQHERR
jgi:hypothetical protein